MPQNELADSLKAKLWDFKYTPFLSSFVISWFIWNYKIVLIFFADIDNINTKIEMLEKYVSIEVNAFPLLTALFYTIFYPYLSNIFYDVTLLHKNNAQKTKRDREDKKVVTQREKKEIVYENRKLRLENYDLENEKVKIIKEFEEKEKNLEINLDEKIQQGIKQYKEKNEKLSVDLKKTENSLDLMAKENNHLEILNDELEQKHQILENSNVKTRNEYREKEKEFNLRIKKYNNASNESTTVLKLAQKDNQQLLKLNKDLTKQISLQNNKQEENTTQLIEKEKFYLKLFSNKTYENRDVIEEALKNKYKINTIQAQAITNELKEKRMLDINRSNSIILSEKGILEGSKLF